MTSVLRDLGHAGARGWRERVAEEVAPRLASRTPAREDQIKAAVGLLFFALAAAYLAQTLNALRKRS
jgi:hypothetical protein